jgi:hypothetical protein
VAAQRRVLGGPHDAAAGRQRDLQLGRRRGAGAHRHRGADLGGGRFRADEGNTAVGNDSNGGQVMRRDRTLGQVDGFGRIR